MDIVDDTAGPPDRPGGPVAARPRRSQHCVLLAVDMASFTDPARTDRVQLALRETLYEAVAGAFDDCSLGWDDCLHEDRGDGMLVVIPARMPTITVVDPLLGRLVERLRRHNRWASGPYLVRLRVAAHIGEVHHDAHGLVGTAVNHLVRLLDAPPLKRALADSGGEAALIVSDYFYDSVVRHAGGPVDPAAFWPVTVEVKQTRTRGWVHLPHSPAGTPALREAASLRPVPRERAVPRGPAGGIAFFGNVTVHGDVVAGDKIVHGDR
ncbi:hypothetical protein [Thermomonospora catenispora]|uniref:hypothetical protein n=1 Tax=Thermomonospora catenispora TaxID=2493090 RepID=UPI001121CE93|nr:hypothetical protein [Thermomonospora catenispora]TNY37462.1 hypothetical protein EIO00_08380 [Thermomonospora catenispora]